MKINKNLIILSLLLVFCITLGAVSATEDISADTDDNSVAAFEGSVMNEEINTVSDSGIHYSSEIYDEIKNATGTYNITADYQIDKTLEITNNNVIIEGNNHTIYGNKNQAFRITGDNIIIQNLNFVNCTASRERGGAILFLKGGAVSNCNFVGCSARGSGGAVFFWEDSVVDNCIFVSCNSNVAGGGVFFSSEAKGFVSHSIFVDCSARSSGGAVDMKDGSVNYCIFENNKAYQGNAIYTRSKINGAVDFNFFGLQNNVTNFPVDLISGAVPDNWVVLDIVNSSGEYVVKFVVMYGPDLTGFMPDYNANLNINGVSKDICIKNNSFRGALVDGTYLLTSLNTGNTLAKGIRDYNYDMNVGVEDIVYGQDAIINVTLPADATGSVTLLINNSYITRTVKEGKVYFNITKLDAGSYDFSLNYGGNNVYASKIVNGSFNVKKYSSEVYVMVPDVPYLSDVNVTVILDALNPSGNVTYYLNAKKYTVRDVSDLDLIIKNLYGGFYSLVVVYSGDLNNLNSSASCNFTVIRNDTYVMNISANNITVGEVVHVVVTLPDDAFGYVDLYINEEYYRDTGVRSGISKFDIAGLNPDEYIIKAVYSGDGKYSPSSVSVNVTVSGKNTPVGLTVADIIGVSESTVKVDVGVHDLLGTPVNEGTIIISLDGKEYVSKVSDGVATFDIVLPEDGVYSANVFFNGEGTSYANNTCNFTVTSVENNATEDINKTFVSNNMENCGNPLVALLIALISLPVLRRRK